CARIDYSFYFDYW
nr:immunoglobulin heavy chain junction region [Mus musculus]